MAASAVLRQTADALSGAVGGFVGGRIAGPRGAVVGRAVAPKLIEKGAMRVKRKASAYSKRYGAAFKRLKKKHPRSSFGALSKKAHRAAKKGSK